MITRGQFVPLAKILGDTFIFRGTEMCTPFCCYKGVRLLSRASDRSRTKKSNLAGFLGTNSRKNRPISREFSGQKAIGKKRPILWLFSRQILLEINRFRSHQSSIFNVFLTEVMAKPLTSWLVPSFSQHNLFAHFSDEVPR